MSEMDCCSVPFGTFVSGVLQRPRHEQGPVREDSNTLITLEVHVNGKIKRRVTGNRWVTTGEVRLK